MSMQFKKKMCKHVVLSLTVCALCKQVSRDLKMAGAPEKPFGAKIYGRMKVIDGGPYIFCANSNDGVIVSFLFLKPRCG